MDYLTIQSKLEEKLERCADSIACEQNDSSLTYSEIDRRANYIANRLIENGIEKGTFVGILLADRMELIFSIIGVIKAGCVFIPLDPAYPDKRIDAMIRTTGMNVVILDKASRKRFRTNDDPGSSASRLPQGVNYISIDELFSKEDPGWFGKKPVVTYSPEDKIYVYFTSGTTGTPKAILGKNGSLLHFIDWEIETFGINNTFRFSQFTNPGFDVYLRDILVPLCAGARICIPDYHEVLLDSDRLAPWIAAYRITLIHCVPSLFRLINAHPETGKEFFEHLGYILFAGEKVNPNELKKWYERNGEHTQLVNLYGPTETTLAKVFHLIQRSDADSKNIPIGKPIKGARVIILDRDMEICDELEVGELYIRTPYRSFGYYNDPSLNKQKFIPNPFIDDPDDLIYKTGDLGRILPDGNIQLVGRVDRQVKIRGRRIELEEIETVLHRHTGVKEAAVIKKETENGNVSLHAFAVPVDGAGREEQAFTRGIKNFIDKELPEYMVPTSLTLLEKIPRKPNLKVDFEGLAVLLQEQEKEYIAPRSKTEKELVETWSELLGMEKEKIGISDDFFELGGNSLNVMTLISRIHRKFNIKLSLGEIFANLTVRDQAVIIQGADEDKFTVIQPVEKRDYYALSSAQKRLYVLYQMDVGSIRYNLPAVMSLAGELNINRFEDAVRGLLSRHESLRTSFLTVDGRPVQRVRRGVEFRTEFFDLAGKEDLEPGTVINNFIRPFDLSCAPLLRVGLIKLEEGKHVFMYDMHHVIADGTSRELLKNEFLNFYAGEEFPALRIRYIDYSGWQNRQRQLQALTRQEEYWLKEFSGEIPVLNLPTDYPRPKQRSFEGKLLNFRLDEEDIEALRTLALQEGLTLYMVVLTIFILFLGRLCGREEVIVGTPTAGRVHEDLENLIGMFVNTLAIKTGPVGTKRITDFLSEVKDKNLGAFENQWYQFEDLVNKLILPRDVSRNPLFDVMFVFHNIDTMRGNMEAVGMDDLDALPFDYRRTTTRFDLTLRVVESKVGLNFAFDYCTRLFKQETIEKFIVYFKHIMAGVIEDRDREIASLTMLPRQERKRLLHEFNNTAGSYPHDKTIHRLFEEQAEKSPDKGALIFESRRCNYRELNDRSNRLARLLRKKGLRPGKIAGIMIEPSIEMIVGILAVLKAGAAYLPIEPGFPVERTAYMLSESQAVILLEKNSKEREQQVRFAGEVVGIEEQAAHQGEVSNLNHVNTPEDPVYLIFTSGTTGKPKGVLLKHENLVNYCHWFAGFIGITGADKSVLTSSFAFDLGYTVVYPLLLHGGELNLIARDIYLSPETLIDYITAHGITYIKVTPTLFSLVVNSPAFKAEKCKHLRVVVLGGEPIKVVDVEQAHRVFPRLQIMNHYGPTETTIGSVAQMIDFDSFEEYCREPTIGTPILNTGVYILDKYFNPVPVGIPGELCIGGAGVAYGYLNRQDLTTDRFVFFASGGPPFCKKVGPKTFPEGPSGHLERSPHNCSDKTHLSYSAGHDSTVETQHLASQSSKEQKGVGARRAVPEELANFQLPTSNFRLIYRTGDIAAFREDGKIKLYGRTDDQVKIRGYRVETREIEHHLLSHEDIKDAAVVDRERENRETFLCAYVVLKTDLPLSRLREYLLDRLPEYMVPAYFTRLEHIPLGKHNKVDRQALPEPGIESEDEYLPPRNVVEKTLVETWQRVLGRDTIGINENFFMIGGDSIKTIQIISRMSKAGYKVGMRDIFQYPTIGELAPFVKKSQRIPDQSVITGVIPLTPIQERFFAAPAVDRHHYNQSIMLYSRERLSVKVVEDIFRNIQYHHDALRMTFHLENDRIVQTCHGLDYPLSIEEVDLCGPAGTDSETGVVSALEQEARRIQASIDLKKGPLMKVGLFHLDDGDRLLAAVHHLVFDAVSLRILLEDIETLYRQYNRGEPFVLPAKTDSYQLWARELSAYADSPEFLKQKDYWRSLISTAADVPAIPKDFDDRDKPVKDQERVSFYLGEEETGNLLTKVNRPFGTEINDILLTALTLAIHKTYGLRHAYIALEGHGREDILGDIDITRTIGWFTCIYPIILSVTEDDDLSRLIKEVKETLRRLPDKGTGYGILRYLTAAELKTGMDFGSDPQVSFNYLGQFNSGSEQTAFVMAKESAGRYQSPERQQKYELEITGMITGGRMIMFVDYNKRQYRKERMDAFASSLHDELNRVIAFCAARKEKEYTPADFTFKGFSIDTLDWLSARYDIEDVYTLTPMQEGMLFHTIFDKGSSAYFEQTSYRLRGGIDVNALEKSFRELFKRYDILRTAFVYEGKGIEQPLQVVVKNREPEFLYRDVRGQENAGTSGQLEKLILEFKEDDRRRSFDLGQDVLMRLAVLQAGDGEYEFVWSHHHILMDGWCTGILIRELFELYHSLLNRRPAGLAPAISFSTYIKWLEKKDKDESKRFWEDYLDRYEQLAEVPGKNTLPPQEHGEGETTYRNQVLSFRLTGEKTAGLNDLAGRNNVTLNTTIQALWGILLAKYNGLNDVVFGTVVSGRPAEIQGVESMIGLFINTIPVRVRFEEDTAFTGLIRRVQSSAVDSETYHYFPLAEIQSAHRLKQNLLDHILIFENYPIGEQIEGAVAKSGAGEQRAQWDLLAVDRFEQSSYDFNLVIGPGEQLLVVFSYNALVYDESYLRRVFGHFKELVSQVLEAPDQPVDTFTLLSEEEKEQVLYGFNDTRAEYPRHKTIHRLFEEQAGKTPDHIAALDGHGESRRQITYRELNEKSNRLAQRLGQESVEPGSIVGIMTKLSIEMITAIMGILKAGAAYLPIDQGYPRERIDYMLKDSGTKMVVTSAVLPGKVEELSIVNCELLTVNEMASERSKLDKPPKEADSINNDRFTIPNSQLEPSSLAYIIYTSGSTGRPKGVAVEHRALVNYVWWAAKTYVKGEKVNFPLYTSISFDLTVTSLFTPLITGNTIYIYRGEGKEFLLDNVLDDNKVEAVKLTPVHLMVAGENAGERNISKIKRFIVGGENLETRWAQKVHDNFEGNIEIYNEYGPTEAAVGCMIYKYDARKDKGVSVPIGIPADNVQIYVLDKNMNDVPVGGIGELYIAGDGLARGYINNPELTHEKFVGQVTGAGDRCRWENNKKICSNFYNPAARGADKGLGLEVPSSGGVPEGRGGLAPTSNFQLANFQLIYKTGDLARRLPDGTLEFFGRTDDQLKIRGFRIEPGEIENQLSNHPEIEAAVVLPGESPTGEKEESLCAYIVTGRDFQVAELRSFLSGTLPNHMIPSYFIRIERIPLTASGKIDRRALRQEGAALGTGTEYTAPENDLEKTIAAAWQDVLKIEKVGIHDNFFDIGGDSLKAIRLNSRLNEILNKKISIVVLFEHVTIHSFVAYVDRKGSGGESEERVDRSEVIDRAKQTRDDRRMRRRRG